MNDAYSDAFKSIVPDPPSPHDWADGARRKRRNRGRVVASVAAAAAIALVVPLSLTLGGNSTLIATPGKSPSPQVLGPSPDPAADAAGAAACWESAGRLRDATPEGATEGAVRAWLCGDAGNPEDFPGTVGPLEPLVDGVENIVAFVQAQPEADTTAPCNDDAGPSYRIVLDYGDGSHHVLLGETAGCRTATDGSVVREGGARLFALALGLWEEQRASVTAPDVVALSQCRPPSRSVVPDLPPAMRPMLPLTPQDAVTGFTCVENPAAEYEASAGSVLQPDLVSRIGRSLTQDSEEGLGQGYLPTWVTITGAWGEAITLQLTSNRTFQWFDGGEAMLWRPTDDLWADLSADLDADPSETWPSQAPPPTAVSQERPDDCDGDARAGMRTTDLPNNTLPDGPVAMWLCYGVGSPREPLTGELAMRRVVETFGELPTAPQGSVFPAPNLADVVVDYPDGQRYVIEVDTNASFEVRWGAGRQHIRYGGDEWVLELKKLWRDQRDSRPKSPPIAPTVGVCDGPVSNIGRPLDRYDVDGALCTVMPTDSGSRGIEIPASPTLIAEVRADARESRTPWLPEKDENPMLEWAGDTIMLVDDYGDRLALVPGSDGTWYWREGQDTWQWTPGPDLAARIARAFEEGRPAPQATHS